MVVHFIEYDDTVSSIYARHYNKKRNASDEGWGGLNYKILPRGLRLVRVKILLSKGL